MTKEFHFKDATVGQNKWRLGISQPARGVACAPPPPRRSRLPRRCRSAAPRTLCWISAKGLGSASMHARVPQWEAPGPRAPPAEADLSKLSNESTSFRFARMCGARTHASGALRRARRHAAVPRAAARPAEAGLHGARGRVAGAPARRANRARAARRLQGLPRAGACGTLNLP